MRIGSGEHRDLFCHSFIASHRVYEPHELAWPALDDAALERLRAIPIWSMALQIETNAGAMVKAFAQTLSDPLIREAVALQGYEEERHARMIGTMVERYGLRAEISPPGLLPTEPAFVHFGYSECVDSFFGFGLFRLAGELRFVPDALIALFTRVLDEEARHIVFFINWIEYERARRGGARLRRLAGTALGYLRKLRELAAIARSARGAPAPPDTGELLAGMTIERFLGACVAENRRQMAAFDARLLRPRVVPVLAACALRALRAGAFVAKLWPRRRAAAPG